MRVCTKCSEPKDETEFFVKDKAKGKLHTQCKDCYKQHRISYYADHYQKYGEEYRARAKARRIRYREAFHQMMLTYMNEKCCEICCENDIRVLEFDHINPMEKEFSISQALRLGYSWEQTLSEISKCRILCANCHKKHTANQFNWYKL